MPFLTMAKYASSVLEHSRTRGNSTANKWFKKDKGPI